MIFIISGILNLKINIYFKYIYLLNIYGSNKDLKQGTVNKILKDAGLK